MKVKEGLHSIGYSIIFAMVVFGIIQIYVSDEVDVALKEKVMQQSTAHPFWTFIFVKTLDELTPTFTYDIPGISKTIYLVNEVPAYGSFHLVFTMILVAIVSFIVWFLKTINLVDSTKFIMITIFLFLMIFGYFAGSIVMLKLYEVSAEKIGFTDQDATTFRNEYNNSFDNVLTPLILASLITIIFTLILITKKATKE